jgi:hypothetical protein
LGGANWTGRTFTWPSYTERTCTTRTSGGYLRNTNLSSADLSPVRQLTQKQLGEACGDYPTQLTPGLTIMTCPVTAPPSSP